MGGEKYCEKMLSYSITKHKEQGYQQSTEPLTARNLQFVKLNVYDLCCWEVTDADDDTSIISFNRQSLLNLFCIVIVSLGRAFRVRSVTISEPHF